MPLTALSIIKSWFVTGAKPTQAQFSNVFDSFRYGGTAITINDLSADLQNAINSIAAANGIKVVALQAGTETYQMPSQSCLVAALMFDASNPFIGVGLTNSDTKIYDPQQLKNGVAAPFGFYPLSGLTTIFFNGVTANTTIKVVYI